MRKGRDGEKKNGGKKRKRLMIIMATTSLPAVDRPNAERRTLERRTLAPMSTNNLDQSVLKVTLKFWWVGGIGGLV